MNSLHLSRIVVVAILLNAASPLHSGDLLAQQKSSSATSYAPAVEDKKKHTSTHELILEARLTNKGASVESGLVWRVFSPVQDKDGKLPVIGVAQGGTSALELAAGTYLVHVAYGQAGATKKVVLAKGGVRETFVMEAGGLRLSATTGDSIIKNRELMFSVLSGEKGSNNKRKVIARNVPANRIVRLNAGTYHVISKYGGINAAVRAELRVHAGKLTEATLQHRAAQITLKLVSSKGGEAIADTAWSIVSGQGAVVKESSSTFPTMVLASGDYTAVARNGGTVFSRDFKVAAGKNGGVEVLAKK